MQQGTAQDRSPQGGGEEFLLRPIGYVRCDHVDVGRTPLRREDARGCKAKVEVLPEYEEGLDDLQGFSHIFLLFVFDRAGPSALKVKPRVGNVKRGLFATRSPRRPNPIGLSLVRLVKREKNVLFIEDEDLLDGTPIVDIKPFIPGYDTATEARSGWLEQVSDMDAQEIGSRGRKEPGE